MLSPGLPGVIAVLKLMLFANSINSAKVEKLKMATGTVKWFNDTKGFGFITPDGETRDIFVHKSVVLKSGMRTLVEGMRVRFDITEQRGKPAADNIQEESAA